MNNQLNDVMNLFDLLQEAACVLDAQCRIQHANDGLATLLGESAETISGLDLCVHWLPVVDEEIAPQNRAALNHVIEQGETLLRTPAILEVGQEKQLPVTVTVTPVPFGGAEDAALLIVHNRSEIKTLEETAQRSARQFEEIQLLANVGYWEWRPDSKTIFGADALNRLLGHNSAESITTIEDYLDLVHDEDRERVSQLLTQATGDTALNYTMRIKHSDNALRTFSVYGEPVFDTEGNLERMRGCTQDITGIFDAIQELQISKRRFETVFEDAAIGIVLIELDGTIVRANPAWVELMGLDADILQGRNFNAAILPSFRPRCETLFAELVSRRKPRDRYVEEVLFGRKDGSTIWINMTVSLIQDANGQPQRVLAMLEDISQRRATAAELQEVKRRLAQSREKERLRLAQDLHDGPMQDLYAMQFLLQKLNRHITPEGKSTATIIQATFKQVNEKLRTLTGELRPPTLVPFGLETAIRAHLSKFRELYPNIQVHLDLMPDGRTLPEYMRLTLYRIQQEMLNNVVKHAAATHVTIEFSFTESDILLEIRDDGCGFNVPARWIELAREDHFGLLGAAERAEEIDGTLVVLSSPGQGTTVRVSAPRPH